MAQRRAGLERRKTRQRRSEALRPLAVAACLTLLAPLTLAGQPAIEAGTRLEDALQVLRQQGLRLVYTSRLVKAEMRVTSKPTAHEPREILDQLLRPHGLRAVESLGGRIVIRAAKETGKAPARESRKRLPEPEPPRVIPQTRETIDVTARWPSIAGRGLSTATLEGAEIESLPRLGGDALRAMTAMPGTTGTDVSANLHVRGGRQDEVMVRLDGLELVEPFHLQDAQDALSIFAPNTIASAELVTGGLSAEYGDRMGGVLDLTTVDPDWRWRSDLELSTLQGQAASSGTWDDARAQWLASARHGTIDFPFEIAGREESPGFWDGFAKVDYQLRQRHSLRANVLFAEDWLDFSDLDSQSPDGDDPAVNPIADALSDFQTRYRNTYAWLHHQAILGQDLVLETRASASHLERDRRGRDDAGRGNFVLRDERDVKVASFGQDWRLRLTGQGLEHGLRAGFDLRLLRVGYDYLNDRVLADPLAAIRDMPRVGVTRFDEHFSGRQLSVYVADRLELDRLTVDVGMRFDEHTLIDDRRVSPRLSLTWSLGERARLRAAWGRYTQGQRLYELQVADGETGFSPPELAEHWNLGFERVLIPRGRDGRRSLSLRAELYHHEIAQPRARYENVFEPISLVPELEADRIRIAPERGRAQGFELFLEGSFGRRLDWFLGYTLAVTEDFVDGRFIPRSIDQPHGLDLNVSYRTRWGWDLQLAWRAHTGWPTTALEVRQMAGDDGRVEILPVLGPLYGERLPDYHRVDLRASRRWDLARGRLTLYANVQNVADRDNTRGFDVRFVPTADGRIQAVQDPKAWAGIVPEAGVRWSF